MSKRSEGSTPSLFNNPLLSDVTIKQIAKGKTREYHAHKAILSANSSYFFKAFTGNFKEASEKVLEVHDDDPDQFEFLLRYIYTNIYDKAVIDKLAANDASRRVLVPIGIYAIADKYDFYCIQDAIANDVQSLLNPIDFKVLEAVIAAHYKTTMVAGSPLGTMLSYVVLEDKREFMHKPEYRQLLLSNTLFGADMALALESDTVDCRCNVCTFDFTVRRHVANKGRFCPSCKSPSLSGV